MTHKLSGNAETREVCLDGKFLDPKPSQKHYNHSPDGFNWGYGGSGPAQLALAIMLKLTGKAEGYQDFKFKIIAAIPEGKDFDIEFDIMSKEKINLLIEKYKAEWQKADTAAKSCKLSKHYTRMRIEQGKISAYTQMINDLVML